MRLRNLPVTISLLSLALIASAGNCAVDPPGAPRFPPKPVAGTWVGEVIGVRFRLSITEGAVDNYLNATYLEGAGWLIYGTPAESLAVTLTGGNVGGRRPGLDSSSSVPEDPAASMEITTRCWAPMERCSDRSSGSPAWSLHLRLGPTCGRRVRALYRFAWCGSDVDRVEHG